MNQIRDRWPTGDEHQRITASPLPQWKVTPLLAAMAARTVTEFRIVLNVWFRQLDAKPLQGQFRVYAGRFFWLSDRQMYVDAMFSMLTLLYACSTICCSEGWPCLIRLTTKSPCKPPHDLMGTNRQKQRSPAGSREGITNSGSPVPRW